MMKFIPALALSVLLALSAAADAQTEEVLEEILTEVASVGTCRDHAYQMVPKGKLLTVEKTDTKVSRIDDEGISVHVLLNVTIDGNSLYFSCTMIHHSDDASRLVPGSYFSKVKP